ncbi:protein transport protein Sec24A-like isoform X2 [Babylonia areolata]|uniref:protein transport protein Sec24A-like isoform X2 n=1 Tax=Babylonia areolata TaxID=304850 RepID=UPI003FCF233B
MADRDQSHHFGQPVRPPIPYQGVANQPAGHASGFQGAPKMAGMPHIQGQDLQGGPPHGFPNMNPSVGQVPPQRFNSGPVGPPPMMGGNVNGFVPPASQGQMPPRSLGMNRPPGPQVSASGAPSQPVGGFRPPVSGQFVPANSFYNSAPPGSGPIVNGTVNAPHPFAGLQQPPTQPPNHFQAPPLSQGGPNAGSPHLSMPSAQPLSSTSGGGITTVSSRMTAPPPSGSIGSQSASVSNASGASTPSSGFPSSSNELPVPYHGHAQYSHQIGAAMKLTPNPTPNSSEPPSQKSSRGPSPVNEWSYDALEQQFSPGQGQDQPPVATGGHPPHPTSQGPPGQQQRMPLPPRPGLPGAQGPYTAPPQRQPQPQMYAAPLSVSQAPGSRAPPPGTFSQPGAPTQPPGPPRPPFTSHSQGPPLAVPPGPRPPTGGPRLPGPPTSMAGPPQGPLPPPPSSMPGPLSSFPGPPSGPVSSMVGPPSGFSGPPQAGPPSGPTGPPSGPGRPMPGPLPSPGHFNLGPPTSSGQGPAPGSNYPQPPPTSLQGMVRPPLGPPTGPPSGPLGPPSGPYGQPPSMGQPGYPQPALGQNTINNMAGDFNRMGVSEMQRDINLLKEKTLISPDGVETARPNLSPKHVNCNPDVFRCTLNAIPQSSALLNKSRLPLGILIHPFKDLSQLPVIQSSVIVRCRSCRTYINPFVVFVDQRRWKCNLCFRVNELPDEFSFDPVSKTYGDPQRRPEIKSATIEFIAPSEYMLRPPQPAVYLFVLDVSFNAVETGYLRLFTQTLMDELDRLPGDGRTQVGFLCFDRALYFFNLSEGLSQPQMLVVPDLEDVFLPIPDSLLVNLHECRDMVVELLTQLPNLFEGNHETGNALGTALQAAFKLMNNTGGRVTVMQTTLPTVGPGALENREASSKASSLNASNLGPASDFYKKLALDCSAQQVAVDLFMLNGQYADIASISCISKYSSGCVQYYPSFHTARNPAMVDKFESDLRRYLTRKIGFESVMRIRCTRGVSIHTFHGNFFVRSTDLLSLPNVNPDAGFGMQMSIEDTLTESSNVCFQAALLYTSSKGERRIRVHTLCVPTTSQLTEVFAGADQQAIAALLAKMAVDRTISASLEDAREALMNACQDMLNAYAAQIPASQRAGALVAPWSLRLFPLYTLAMLKSAAFRLSANIKLDDRVYAHLLAKTTPISSLLQTYYPHLYPVHALNDEEVVEVNDEKVPKAPHLHLSSANLDRHGVYVMDQGHSIYLLVGSSVSDAFCQQVLDVPNFKAIPGRMMDLPELDNPTSDRIRNFINYLMDSRPGGVSFLVLRDDTKQRNHFFQYMVEDRTESSMSYYEFLQFLKQKVKG